MKINLAVVLVIMFMFSAEGCAMDLNLNKENNYNSEENDFISEEKALLIARRYIVDEGIDLYDINKLRLIDEKDYHYDAIPKELFETDWIIIIPTKLKVQISQGLKWGIVYVNKKTGEVTSGGMGPS